MKKSEFRSLVRSRLGSYMKDAGFSMSKKEALFYRENECGVFHILVMSIDSIGILSKVYITACVPEEFDNQAGKSFLDGYLTIGTGGRLGPSGLNSGFDSDRLDSPDGVESFFENVRTALDRYGFAFFETMKTREDIWNGLSDETRSALEEKGKKTAILKGRSWCDS